MVSITTTESLHYLTTNPWNIPSVKHNRGNEPLLITVSGNYNLGKSAFMNRLGARLFQQDSFTILIDESSFRHRQHPYGLREADSNFFSFIVYMMAQRDILIKSWLNCGFNVIIERSFTEDFMLSCLLNDVSLLSESQTGLHSQLHESYMRSNRKPDCIIYFNYPEERSRFNHESAVRMGQVPAFFCGDIDREKWFSACHSRYKDFAKSLQNEDIPVLEHRYDSYEDLLVSDFMRRFF
ncbi:MAG: hypothetical protein EOO84_11060 [Pantoea sp.]|uniref:deoxynucleoside kinase n=1 Tax=Pantoea sp. TaxID=69393 RepID=UPI0011FEFD23|nr:deoxynucleoside kinase [Pantoea sp.]RZK07219.1 MAG: hypothetical protein EOO84_11060 [Pantoea sp.]